MKKNMTVLLALLLVFALSLSACGKDAPAETVAAAPAETAAPQPLSLTNFELSASTWSSPNGATIHLTAVPSDYMAGQTAAFVVRLEGEALANVPCTWDDNGNYYTASADVTAENDLCYYVVLTSAAGQVTEVAISTPVDPQYPDFTNMADALNSYANLVVENSSFEEGKLTISAGTAQVQAPRITDDNQPITCKEAKLILTFDGEDIASEKLTLEETGTVGLYELALSNISFDVPALESDQQLTLRLEVALSNGQVFTAPGGTWYSSDTGVLPAVG